VVDKPSAMRQRLIRDGSDLVRHPRASRSVELSPPSGTRRGAHDARRTRPTRSTPRHRRPLAALGPAVGDALPADHGAPVVVALPRRKFARRPRGAHRLLPARLPRIERNLHPARGVGAARAGPVVSTSSPRSHTTPSSSTTTHAAAAALAVHLDPLGTRAPAALRAFLIRRPWTVARLYGYVLLPTSRGGEGLRPGSRHLAPCAPAGRRSTSSAV
jgi:hypothetical protein